MTKFAARYSRRCNIVIIAVMAMLLAGAGEVAALSKSTNVALVPNNTGRFGFGGTLPIGGFPGGYAPSFTNVDPFDIGVSEDLSGFDTVVLVGICDIGSANFLGDPVWKATIDAFVAGGGKLLIWDSECQNTDYSNFLLPFSTNNPGQLGANGTLGVTEENSLSRTNVFSSRFVDVGLVGSQTDAVGDANVFISQDPLWCVDMRAINASIGAPARPTHTYSGTGQLPGAGFGDGLIIYNGLDKDFMFNGQLFGTVNGRQNLGRIWLFELLQPFNPDALPCGVPVTCGNGVLDPGEQCDPAVANSCSPGENCEVNNCVCVVPPFCGDGVINAPEQCDPLALPTGCAPPLPVCNGATCICEQPTCGNNQVEANELCDGTDDNACPGLCLPAGNQNECQCPVCGDDDVNQPGEECDGIDQDACLEGCNPPFDPQECRCVRTCTDDPSPLTQGYWHRQCLGAGLITPGRNGRGPTTVLEPDFLKTLVPAVDTQLATSIFAPPTFLTCEDGIDAVPPSDKCERALKQYTAMLLNLASDRVQVGCEVDLAAEECGATICAKSCVSSGDSCESDPDCQGSCPDGSACSVDADCPGDCNAVGGPSCSVDADCPGACVSLLGPGPPFSTSDVCTVDADCPLDIIGLPQSCGPDTCDSNVCSPDVCESPCSGPDGSLLRIGDLVDELEALINSADVDNCRLAAACAGAVNEDVVFVSNSPLAPPTAPSSLQTFSLNVIDTSQSTASAETTQLNDETLQPGGNSAGIEEPGRTREPNDGLTSVPTEASSAVGSESLGVGNPAILLAPDSSGTTSLESETVETTPGTIKSIDRHLAVIANAFAPKGARKVSEDALLTALGGGYKPEVRLQIVRGLLGKVDVAYYSLLAKHLEDIRAEARDFSNEKLAKEATKLLKRLDPSTESAE